MTDSRFTTGSGPLRIGIVSPFMPHDLADLLDGPSRKALEGIRGVLATPVTPLARELHRRGHDLSVFCLDGSVRQPGRLRGERLSIHVLPKRRNRYCLMDFYRQEGRFINDAIAREKPGVLSAQWSYEHAWAALQSGLPTVVTCHDTPLRYAWIINRPFTWCHLVLAWRVIRKAHRLVCVSPYTAAHIRRLFAPRGAVDVVPNGLLPDVFQRGQRRVQRDEATGRPWTFCTVGGWGRLKNVTTLLKAFERVRTQEPNARLVLLGRDLGPGQAAEQWARQRQLERGVEFLGSVSRERILDFLETEPDMMVHPSLIECHPMVLIEAMACGVPVIGGLYSGGVAWTLEEGRCGFLCDVRDAKALASTMLCAMHQPDRNREMVARARASVTARFQLETVATSMESILRQEMAESKSTR